MTGAETEAEPELQELLEVALGASASAVERIHEHRPRRLRVGTKSSDTDHVTEMDLQSEELIRAHIAARRPHDAVLGEEHGGRIEESGITWIVDPIDGTTNYLYDHPGYAVSVAAWAGGRPLVGVVEDPTHGRTYFALRAGGSFCGTRVDPGNPTEGAQRLRLADPAPLGQMLVATGFGYDPQRRAEQGGVAAALLPRIRDIRRMGAAAVDLCSVAAGRVDAYYEAGLSIWDLAAGQLIASEAGAAVEAIEGGPARPGSVLAAHPGRIRELREALFDCEVARTLPGPEQP